MFGAQTLADDGECTPSLFVKASHLTPTPVGSAEVNDSIFEQQPSTASSVVCMDAQNKAASSSSAPSLEPPQHEDENPYGVDVVDPFEEEVDEFSDQQFAEPTVDSDEDSEEYVYEKVPMLRQARRSWMLSTLQTSTLILVAALVVLVFLLYRDSFVF